jgi:prevent-host-death family protein
VVRRISQRELRNESGEIMRAVDRGQSFIVTRNGIPIAELTPLRQRQFVPLETVLAALESAPRIDAARLRAEVDAYLAQDPTPRA